MRVIKLRVDEMCELDLKSLGLDLTDMLRLLVFGDRRETADGTEFRLDLDKTAEVLGSEAVSEMSNLRGIVILVSGEKIKRCRLMAESDKIQEDKKDVRIE